MRRLQPIKPASPTACRLLLWVIAALVFGQSFGSVHRIVHAPSVHFAFTQPAAFASAEAPGPGVGKSSLARWFGVHSASDCALIDHALQPSPPAVLALLPVPVVIAGLPPLAMAGLVPAGPQSSFQARGPPFVA